MCSARTSRGLIILKTTSNGREFLLDHFSVADGYLFTVINWTMATPPIELAKWPVVKAYYERLRARPEHRQERSAKSSKLYKAELAREKTAGVGEPVSRTRRSARYRCSGRTPGR